MLPTTEDGLSLSRWVCSTGGFEVSWTARMRTARSESTTRTLQWETLEGLKSSGAVSFTPGARDAAPGTHIEMRVDHSLPSVLGRAIGEEGLRGLVEATLRTDLERFSDWASQTLGKSEMPAP